MYILLVFPAWYIVRSTTQSMYAAPLTPLLPGCRVLTEGFTREDTVSGGVLHVDVQVGAFHGDDEVDVYLEVV